MKQIRVPTLIVAGDQDEPCIEASILMNEPAPLRRCWCSRAAATLLSGRTCAIQPFLEQFFHQVESGRWALASGAGYNWKNVRIEFEAHVDAQLEAIGHVGWVRFEY